MCSKCLCRTCLNNCNGEHWCFSLEEKVEEENFCYPCEDKCYYYEMPITKCPKYQKSQYYIEKEKDMANKKATQMRGKIKLLDY